MPLGHHVWEKGGYCAFVRTLFLNQLQERD